MNYFVLHESRINYLFLLSFLYSGITVNCVHPGYVMSDMTRGAGSVTPADAAAVPVALAREPPGAGLYMWHTGRAVPWDGPDPRSYIDGRQV